MHRMKVVCEIFTLTSGFIRHSRNYHTMYHKMLSCLTFLFFLVGCVWHGFATQPSHEISVDEEQVVIWTDRDVYIAGEHVFYTFNLINPFAGEEKTSKFGYMAVRGRYGLVEKVNLKLSDNHSSHGNIYLSDTLSSGLYEIIGFTNWMRNTGEESYFRKTILIANRFDDQPDSIFIHSVNHAWEETATNTEQHTPPLQSVTQADIGSPGEVLLQLKPGNVFPKRGKVSLSVNLQNCSEKINSLKITVTPSIARQNFAVNTSQASAVDKNAPSFLRETSTQVITARLTHQIQQSPMAGIRIILNVADSIPNMLYAKTGHDGVVHFLVNDYYANKDLVFSVDPQIPDNQYDLKILDPFNFQLPFKPPAIPADEQLIAYIRESQDVLTILKAFNIDYMSGEEPPEQMSKAPLVYAAPSQRIRLDDYYPLDNLREIARELIPSWRFRSTAGNQNHAIVCQTSRNLLPGSPVFFVDGIIQANITPWQDMGSEQIREIQVLNLNWMHGDMNMPGIVAIYTRNQAYQHLASGVVRYHNETNLSTGNFSPPAHHDTSATDHGMPDLRRLLFMYGSEVQHANEPMDLEWFASDLGGEYIVNVSGMTESGQVFSESMTLTIK
jgi:hypothetical protein